MKEIDQEYSESLNWQIEAILFGQGASFV